MMKSGRRQHPVTVTPLKVAQIHRFFAGTPVIDRLPTGPEVPLKPHGLELLGGAYQVSIGGSAATVEIRISKGEGATQSPAAAPGASKAAAPTAKPPRAAAAPRVTEPVGPAVDLPTREAMIGALRDTREATGSYSSGPVLTIEHNDELHAGGHHGGDDLRGDGVAIPLPVDDSGSIELLLDRDGMGMSGGVEPAPRRASTPLALEVPPSRSEAVASPRPEPRPSASGGASSALAGPLPIAPTIPAMATADPARVEVPATSAPLRGPVIRARPGARVHPGLQDVLTKARQHAASDVHIMSDGPVRMRRVGALEPVGTPVPAADVEMMIPPLLTDRHAEQLNTLGYADVALDVERAGRMRINVSRQRGGFKLCFRLVASAPPTVASLGLPAGVRKLATHHQGLAIVAGPNGQGKTTTMAALVDMFNADKPLHIITVEDPVEVIHPRKRAIVTQREVGTHTLSFGRALAAALREDPDVIAIGELRDRETVQMALSAAETGHLVLATMSTPSGAKTIDRLIGMFPPDDQSQVRSTLAGALKLVISQRLLRRADGGGQVAAYEMITGTVPLWSLIRDNKLFQLPSLLQRGRNYGMIRLEDSMRELIARGSITEDEARLYAEDPRALLPPSPALAAAGPPRGRLGRGR